MQFTGGGGSLVQRSEKTECLGVVSSSLTGGRLAALRPPGLPSAEVRDSKRQVVTGWTPII